VNTDIVDISSDI